MKVLLSILTLSILVWPKAQDSRFFTNLSSSSGLSSNSITAITQDREGFIWVGTKSGINRYDGMQYIHYHRGNSSLRSNDVTALHVDHLGKIWVGFKGGGLFKYDYQTDDFLPASDTLIQANASVNAIYRPDTTQLWVLTDDVVVDAFSGKKLEIHQRSEESLGFASIVRYEGNFWIGTDRGTLLKIDQDEKVFEYAISDISNRSQNRIFSILPEAEGQFLIGTQNDGLVRFSITDESFSETKVEASIVRSLFKDHNGHIWVGTDGNGLYQLHSQGPLKHYQHIYGNINSIASNAIYCIFEDRDNHLWFGTAWDGMSVIIDQPPSFKHYYSDFKGSQSTGVLSILKEADRMWIGSDGEGIHLYPPLSTEWADLSDHLGANAYPQFIRKMNDGHYWIGTFRKGLYRLDLQNHRILHYEHHPEISESISHNDVRDVQQLDPHTFLIATWGGGLNLFNDLTEVFQPVASHAETPRNIVTLAKINGKILVGTFGEGLYVFNPKDQSLSHLFADQLKNSLSICQTDQDIWIGTWGEGLYKTNKALDTIIQITNVDMSATTTVVSILPDESNGIIIGTKHGIYHLDSQHRVSKVNSLNGEYHINSAYKDESGKYYFGNSKRAVSFSEPIDTKESITGVELLDLKLFDESISKRLSANEPLRLAHDQNVLTFEFASLIYPVSSDAQYLVKVDPLNKDWISTGKQRSLTLANLNPGKYKINLRNSSSPSVTSFSFIIAKPWWKTWWAFLSYLLMFMLLLYFFRIYAIRLEKLKGKLSIEQLNHEKEVEIGRIKQKFFINISHEIRTPLTLIIGEIERLTSRTFGHRNTSKSVANIRANSNYILQLINELLDYRKIESDELHLRIAQGNLVKFSKEVFLAFQNLAESKNISLVFETPKDKILAFYDRDQFEKVLFNLLSNAFKYTENGGSITLKITQTDHEVKITVSDTGRGIPEDQLPNVFKRFYQSDNAIQIADSGFGIGLSIVQDIVQLHHGKVWVESEVGKGTRFFVTIPLGKDQYRSDQLLKDFLDSESIQLYKKDAIDSVPEEKTEEPIQREDLVLIVEDNEHIRNFINEVLGEQFRTVLAENGLKALSQIDQELPDIIISDIMMPEMDGITLMQQLRSNMATSHIPVVLLTARTGLVYKREGYEIGADDYITKPFNSALLRARVKNLLENRKLIRERIRTEFLTKPKEIDLLQPDEQFLLNLTEIVDKYLESDQLDAGLISKELGMSHSVVYKKLKSLTGFTLVEFIRDYRLTQASKLLGSFHLSVAEACYKVGFSDRKYFSQMFKRKFNQTPSEYIKANSKA